MIAWIRNKIDNIKYNLEMRSQHQHDTILDFLDCLKWWWAERPRKIKCAACEYQIWFYGRQDSPVYCNEWCAYYGEQLEKENENDIPF